MRQILKRKLIALKYIWKGILQEMADDELPDREPLLNFLYMHPVVYRDHRFVRIEYRVGNDQVKRLSGNDVRGQAKFVLNLFQVAV